MQNFTNPFKSVKFDNPAKKIEDSRISSKNKLYNKEVKMKEDDLIRECYLLLNRMQYILDDIDLKLSKLEEV